MELIWFIIIGIVAGFLAGRLIKGSGFGLIVNLLVGICGAMFGGWLFGELGLTFGSGLFGALLTAFFGAAILLFIISLFKKR
ncbi:GlsB/YeaQ/YmgE family stress response membrane protein [Ancylomarina sp.]|uniref:GlsB/YeaQ/YmgE family stress response membrane protein n=1 Tax=Ancylomarina sp. TaxID=1970196 RepID=UPI003568232E